jgi:hypothetical protein
MSSVAWIDSLLIHYVPVDSRGFSRKKAADAVLDRATHALELPVVSAAISSGY